MAEEKKENPEIPESEIREGESLAGEESASEEKDSWEHKYLRALADYQNLVRQQAREREEFVKYALDGFLQDLLPVYDHLKLSLSGLSEAESANPWAQGVKHVLKQFKDLLASRGVEEIEALGRSFDHNEMDAIDGSGDTVVQEVMPGYKLSGKVIRPAKVIVGEGEDGAESEKTE